MTSYHRRCAIFSTASLVQSPIRHFMATLFKITSLTFVNAIVAQTTCLLPGLHELTIIDIAKPMATISVRNELYIGIT